MTRDDAVQIIAGLFKQEQTSPHTWQMRAGRPECIVDAFVAIGMLKLDEPKSAEQRAMESIVPIPMDARSIGAILNAIDQAGFKIVEK